MVNLQAAYDTWHAEREVGKGRMRGDDRKPEFSPSISIGGKIALAALLLMLITSAFGCLLV